MADLPFAGQLLPGEVEHVPDAVCPSCLAGASTWRVTQPNGRLWVCGECRHLEIDGQVEGLDRVQEAMTSGQ